MFRLGLGILLGWLIFDEDGKKTSNMAGKFIKDKSGEAMDYAYKHIDTSKITEFIKGQILPDDITADKTAVDNTTVDNTTAGFASAGGASAGKSTGNAIAIEQNNGNLNQL